MRLKHVCLIFFALCFIDNALLCQSLDRVRIGHNTVQNMVLKLDSISIVPQSFRILNADTSQFRLDPLSATLYFQDSSLLGKTVFYKYEVFQLDLSKPYSHRQTSIIESPYPIYQPILNNYRTMADIQEDNQLMSSGSISRGVAVGNNQDLVLNSALNLQLSGKLSEDVEILASISDKNIPIQPEGNTQNIRDINNIFITLKLKDIAIINAGDVEIESPNSQFLSVTRNALGMDAAVKSSFSEKFKMKNSVGGGVAKGKFIRQSVTPQNGVQGPYKLYGENNEIGIAVVAGSERVYVDGILLTRGQENDYVIDYNTAEITFMPKMLITTEKRIVVEFEYSDRNYSRINLFTYNELILGKKEQLKIKVNYYQEQDLKNHSIQPELDNDQKLFLSALGDNSQGAYYLFEDTVGLSQDRILYCKKDTLVDGIPYTVYEYSLDSIKQRFGLNFSYMGEHKGSYKLLMSTANGRVFEWVAPQNGELQGNYEPVMLLKTPELLQMATISAEYNATENTKIHTELALSNKDQNLFSKQDDADNVGFAYFLNIGHQRKILSKQSNKLPWQLKSALAWQFVHKNFQSVESFREVEFARNYNLAEDYSADFSEQILQALVAMKKEQVSDNQYSINWFSRIGDVFALRQELMSNNHLGNLVLNTKTSFLCSSDSVQKSRFVTSRNQLAYQFKKFEIGATDLLEYNRFMDQQNNELRTNSYAFNEAVFYIKNSDSTLYKYNLQYKNRVEYAPDDMKFRSSLDIHEAKASFQIERIKNQHFAINATYRNQRMKDTLSQVASEHYFVGNLEYNGRFFKNAIVLNTYYEAGSGMELKKIFTYLQVANGQGTHVWHDYNHNGVEELDEFEVAAFQDEANYVKVWLAGTDYMNTYNNQFTQSVQLRPAAVWINAKGFKRFVARFTNTTMFRSQLKNLYPNFNPFVGDVRDTNIISRVLSLNNTLSFNNSASKFAFDFVVQKNQNKNLLYYGFEQNSVDLQQLVLKSSPVKWLSLQVGYVHSFTDNASELMKNHCYQINQHQIDGDLKFQFKNHYFGAISYQYSKKNNLSDIEHLSEHNLSTMFTYRMAKFGTATATVQLVLIDGAVGDNGTVSYVMLNGLSVGKNALWSVGYQMSINEYLKLMLQYDGRISESHKAVHTGNVTLKAQF